MLPKLEDDPILYKQLKKLWMHKKSIEEDMQTAHDDDDESRYRSLEDQHDALNDKMFVTLRKSKTKNATYYSSDEDYNTPRKTKWKIYLIAIVTKESSRFRRQ